MEEEKKVIRGYKGFDKDLKCFDFQYEVGKEYECKKAVICRKGFHFCENPIDVFKFYPPFLESGRARYCEVEGSGEFDFSEFDKVCCSKIKIVRELTLKELINSENYASINNNQNNSETSLLVFKQEDFSSASLVSYYSLVVNSGYNSIASTTGCYSTAVNVGRRSLSAGTYIGAIAANEGDFSASVNVGIRSFSGTNGKFSIAANSGLESSAVANGQQSLAVTTGDICSAVCNGVDSVSVTVGASSSASATGKHSIAFGAGKDCEAKGALGCWIVLTERDEWNGDCYPIKEVKAFKVDGEKIKPDIYYKLIDGEAVEVTET